MIPLLSSLKSVSELQPASLSLEVCSYYTDNEHNIDQPTIPDPARYEQTKASIVQQDLLQHAAMFGV